MWPGTCPLRSLMPSPDAAVALLNHANDGPKNMHFSGSLVFSPRTRCNGWFPAPDRPSREPIHSHRRLEDAFDQRKVSRVFISEDFATTAHVGAGKFVGCAVGLAKFQPHLPQPQVNPGI